MDTKCNIIIVDDHDILRDGIKFVLTQTLQANIIAEARNGKEFLDLLDNYQPDIVLMDIAMPEMDGVEATKMALKKYPDLKIIALSMWGDEEYYFKMVHAGARGFVLKKTGINELEAAIETVLRGENYFSNELLRNIILNVNSPKIHRAVGSVHVNLTKRELEILQLICNGMSNIEIADLLHISHKTVDGHRNNLLTKTCSKNTVQLVMYAIKNQLITF